MDLWVRSGDRAPESSVEESDVAEAEESEDGQVQNRWCWLLSLMWGALCTQNSCHRARPSTSTFTRISCHVWCGQCERRGDKCTKKSWLPHHDNAPAHNALNIREFLAKNNIAVLEQPPYSPDLAPCDFVLFPKLKGATKEHVFLTYKPSKWPCRRSSGTIPEGSFQECMEAWQRRMEKCVRSQGTTSKATCCSLQFVFGINDLCAQSRCFSNKPRISRKLATGRVSPLQAIWCLLCLYSHWLMLQYFCGVFCTKV